MLAAASSASSETPPPAGRGTTAEQREGRRREAPLTVRPWWEAELAHVDDELEDVVRADRRDALHVVHAGLRREDVRARGGERDLQGRADASHRRRPLQLDRRPGLLDEPV